LSYKTAERYTVNIAQFVSDNRDSCTLDCDCTILSYY